MTIFRKNREKAPTSLFFTSSSSMYSSKLIMMVLNYKSRHLLSSLLLVCRGSSAVCCAEAGSMYEDVRGGHARPACSPRGSRHQHNGYMITIVLIIYQIEARGCRSYCCVNTLHKTELHSMYIKMFYTFSLFFSGS